MAFLIAISGMLPASLSSVQAKTVTGVAMNANNSQGTTNGSASDDSSAKTQADECPPVSAMVNGGFEDPPGPGTYDTTYNFRQADVPGWDTTDNSQGTKVIEIWNFQQGFPSEAKNHPAPPEGVRYAELNAFVAGMLYQDVKTVPGQELHWRLSHMGRTGVDTMQLRIGAVTANPTDTPVVQQMSDGNTAWGTYTGTYTVPAGQTVTRFGFQAVSTANGVNSTGNFLDNIFLGTGPCVVAEKTVSPGGPVHVGDQLGLTYDVAVKNEGGDVAASTVFEDTIPDGTVYVPGSLRITKGPGAGSLTDAQDDDAGRFDSANNKVIVNLGDLPNTNDLPNGVTVEFKVKPLAESAGKTVSNQANVNYTDLLTNEGKTTSSNEVDTPILFDDPKLQSEKSFMIEHKADGNTDTEHPEPGDTLRYTIQTQNVEENSQVVKNMTISDAIPDGLAYVPESLSVDGTAVTDAQDEDAGDSTDGKVTGHFGDVTDKNVHKLEFLATVQPGQAGQDIENTATVGGDNIPPNNPNTVVKVYPRDPKLESTKTVKDITGDPDHPADGDVLEYTISSRNTVSEGIVNNMTISDNLPAGLEYVSNSLKVDGTAVTDVADDDDGDVTDGTVTGHLGDVTDTDVHTVTFQAKLTIGDEEHARDIQNVATVGGDNIDEPDQPAVQVHVDPKTPKLQSEKTSVIEEKLDGNMDTEHPEVGDTLRYTISTHNTVADSLVKNLTISDMIPEGLAYVPGSLKVDGQAVTDAADDDSGSVVHGEVTGQFGDVDDMDDHTVTFLVTVDLGEAGHDITNTATVGGDNTDTPDHPDTVVKVYPRDPKLESTKEVKNLTTGDPDDTVVGDVLEYTISSQNTVSDGIVNNMTISDNLPEGLAYVSGSLKVDGQAVTDAIDNDAGEFANGMVTGHLGDVTDTDVHTVTFQATVTSGESQKDIQNVATVGGDNIDEPDKPAAQIHVNPKTPKLESTKSGILEKKMDGNTDAKDPEVGDTLLYTISTHNTVTDSLVKDLTISDPLPKDLTYVAGSLKVDGQAVTDATDNDAGDMTNGTVEGEFGDVTDTKVHMVTFEAKINSGESQQNIQNVAMVGGDNTPPDHPEAKVHVDPRAPQLQSEKSATLEKKMAGNMDAKHPEVGDTLRYTIQTHNTVTDSLVTGLTISDPLPKGLEYVAGSLKVDGQAVTDAKDQDNGQFAAGTVTGQLGDVTDTKVHTVTFDAIVTSGQAGHDIENTATVSGDNVDQPDKPQATTHIVAHQPILISTKMAKNLDGGQRYEVGDTIVYTIQTHNTVTDSLVKGLVISDPLPKGIKYVPDSLKVDGHTVTDAKDQDKGHFAAKTVTGQLGDVTDTKMHTVTFRATITSDQAGKTITNIAKVNGSNIDDPQTPENQVSVDPEPLLPSTGDTSNASMVMAGILLLLVGIVGFTLMRRRGER